MWANRRDPIALCVVLAVVTVVSAVIVPVGAARTGGLMRRLVSTCDNVAGWHDYRGEYYDCGYWSSWCSYSRISSYASNDGLTPDQACCACGGGADKQDKPPAAVLEHTQQQQQLACVDVAGWHDYRGESHDCSYWDRYCDWHSISSYASNDGLTPDQACCACGGGADKVADEEHTQPEEQEAATGGTAPADVVGVEEQPAGGTCVDVAGWHDDRGESYDCDYWGRFCGSPSYSSWWQFLPYPAENGLLHANEACCACGGGEGSDSLLAATTPVDEPCVSHEGWHDDRGPEYDCAYWSKHCTPGGTYTTWDTAWGCFDDYPGTDGHTPDRACCECGGGIGREDEPASAALECSLEKLSQEEVVLAEIARTTVYWALLG